MRLMESFMSSGRKLSIMMATAIAATVVCGLREEMDGHFFVVQCVMSDYELV